MAAVAAAFLIGYITARVLRRIQAMNAREQSRPSQYMTELTLSVQRHPLQSIGIGFLIGFVVGGRQRTRVGQGLIGLPAGQAVR